MWTYPKIANMLAWRSAAILGGLAVLACVGAADAALVRARVAHTLNVTDEAHLHLTGAAGEVLEEEGPATGALPGHIKARFAVSTSITSSFVVRTSSGSITGHSSARLHSAGTYSSFGGSLKITGGTGRYKHAHGSGGLYGVVNRRTDAMTVQTTGKLSY